MIKCIGMRDIRWRWLGDGGVVLLGNGMIGSHGGMVLVGNFIVNGEMYYKVGFRMVLAR